MYVQLYVVVKCFSFSKMKKGNDFNLQKHNFIFVLAFLELMLLQLNNNVDPNYKCTSKLYWIAKIISALLVKGAGQLGRGAWHLLSHPNFPLNVIAGLRKCVSWSFQSLFPMCFSNALHIPWEVARLARQVLPRPNYRSTNWVWLRSNASQRCLRRPRWVTRPWKKNNNEYFYNTLYQ